MPGAEWIERDTHVRAREKRTIYFDIWIDKWTVKEVDGECLEKIILSGRLLVGQC